MIGGNQVKGGKCTCPHQSREGLICQAINTVYKVPTPTPLDNKIMLTPSMMENYYWIIHKLSATFLYYDIRQREAIISPPQQIRKGLVCCQAIILSTKSPPSLPLDIKIMLTTSMMKNYYCIIHQLSATILYHDIRQREAIISPHNKLEKDLSVVKQ